jgi:PleD family two-component response regulator
MKNTASDVSGTAPIRVSLVDDHAIIRKGIRAVLEPVAHVELVGESENGLHAIKQDHAAGVIEEIVAPVAVAIPQVRREAATGGDRKSLRSKSQGQPTAPRACFKQPSQVPAILVARTTNCNRD